MVGGEFKVVAFLRVGDAAAGEERAAQECRAAVILLLNAEIYVNCCDLRRIIPLIIDDIG